MITFRHEMKTFRVLREFVSLGHEVVFSCRCLFVVLRANLHILTASGPWSGTDTKVRSQHETLAGREAGVSLLRSRDEV
jgi:hypothetical protein